jgi:hypothetical protein
MEFWMDQVREIGAGVTGFEEETASGLHVVAISSNLPGEGLVSLYLNGLPDDRRVIVHDVVSPVIRDALLRRGFTLERGHSQYLNKDCDNYVREGLPSPGYSNQFAAEIRFDEFTFRDLPASDRDSLRDALSASPIITDTTINEKARDTELDERYLALHGKPRPRGGLHGGLGEAVYIYLAGAAIIASKKAIEKIVEEVTKRAFEWLDERYKRRKEVGLAEVTLYGPNGEQINRQAIVYDGRERPKK